MQEKSGMHLRALERREWLLGLATAEPSQFGIAAQDQGEGQVQEQEAKIRLATSYCCRPGSG
jgi:hypothetical protein